MIRGKIHEYLGMTLDCTVRGQVKITMISYIEEIPAAFDKLDPKWYGKNTSATPNNLFVVNKDCKKLNQKKVLGFHNLVENNLYATKRSIPDTCTAIEFLTTRVCAPDKDDWAKLVHLWDTS